MAGIEFKPGMKKDELLEIAALNGIFSAVGVVTLPGRFAAVCAALRSVFGLFCGLCRSRRFQRVHDLCFCHAVVDVFRGRGRGRTVRSESADPD